MSKIFAEFELDDNAVSNIGLETVDKIGYFVNTLNVCKNKGVALQNVITQGKQYYFNTINREYCIYLIKFAFEHYYRHLPTSALSFGEWCLKTKHGLNVAK